MNNINWWHRILMPDGQYTPGVVNHGPDGEDWPTTRFGMPKDLTGKTVLDIGCRDGFFAFEAERRNGLVTAGDLIKSDGFKYAKHVLKSHVTWTDIDIEKFQSFMQYDVVLFYGVLYHLKSPLRGLENVFEYTREGGICLLETAITTINDIPMLEYMPRNEGDVTNFFRPNEKWVRTATAEIGFKTCNQIWTDNHSRSTFRLTK